MVARVGAFLVCCFAASSALPAAQQGALETAAGKGCDVGCHKIRNPVCGSDGQMYDNDCLLKEYACVNGISDLQQRPLEYCSSQSQGSSAAPPRSGDILKSCVEKIKCSRIRSPVCASDGNTYNNECLVRVQACIQGGGDGGSLQVVARGTCQNPLPADDSPPATAIEDPVRDAVILVQKRQATYQPFAGVVDFVTGPKQLFRRREGGGGVGGDGGFGRGCPVVACTLQYAPVCGSDGVTYSNSCELEARQCGQPNLRLRRNGDCRQQEALPDCLSTCPTIYRPVCGSNGLTYGNDCELRADSCKSGIDIYVAEHGECRDAYQK